MAAPVSKSKGKKRLEELKKSIEAVDLDLTMIQSKMESLKRRKATLQEKRTKLEMEVNQLEISCKSPDVNFSCSDFGWSQQLHELKTSKFGIKSFRPYQEEVINATMLKRDVILVMPTGGGKSLCFQLPALLSDGFTLVVSPLVSLMEDQAMNLQSSGIAATLLSSSTSPSHLKVVHQDMVNPKAKLKLLYVTPEKIAKSKRFMAQLQRAYDTGTLSRIAIDEVHCCSQWGHDFRPDYKVLGILKRQFPRAPILGLTATASSSVLSDVKSILNIAGCDVFRSSYNRANLFYEVRLKPPNKEFTSHLLALLKGEFANSSGIIYCFSRKDTENLAEELSRQGVMAAAYHAYIEPEDRSMVHKNWRNGHIQVVVATTAFGMGIDKPDVRFVIHHSLSKSVENYYQESGRAGRDDKPASCILFFGFSDVFRQSTMVVMEQTGLQKLYQMIAYCILHGRCRRASLAEHFDESWERGVECNKMCDTCKTKSTVVDKDVTGVLDTIIKILSKSHSRDQRLTGLKLVDLVCKEKKQADKRKLSKCDYQSIILHLLLEGYLKEDFHFTPYSTISYICPGTRVNYSQSNGLTKVTIPWGGGKSEGKDHQRSEEHPIAMDEGSSDISGLQFKRNVEVKGQSRLDVGHENGEHLKMIQKQETKNDIIVIDDDSDDDGDDDNDILRNDEVCQEPSTKRSQSLLDQSEASSVAVRLTERNDNSKPFKSNSEANIKGEMEPLSDIPSCSYKEVNNGKVSSNKMLQKPKIKQRLQNDGQSSVSKVDSSDKSVDSSVSRKSLSGCRGKHSSASLPKNPKGNREQEKLRSKVKRKVFKEKTGEDVIDLYDVHDTKKESKCSTGLKIRSSEHSSISMKLPRVDSSEMTNVIKSSKGKRKLDRYPPGDLSKRTKYPPSELSLGE